MRFGTATPGMDKSPSFLQFQFFDQTPVLDIVRNVVKRLEWTDSELPLGPETPIE
jgi:hypothetical protein